MLAARALIANGVNVNAVSKGGATPIMIAAERGKMEMVQLLIKHQADINAKSQNGASPLISASAGGHEV
jgi:ankyrin repeat protein